jgi:hexosaminidase
MIASRSTTTLSRIALLTALLLPLICLGGDGPKPAPKAANANAATAPALIPIPESLRMRKGSFTIDASTPLRADGDAAQSAVRLFSDFVAKSHGLTLEPSRGAKAKDGIDFVVDASLAGDEAYVLEISPSRIEVRGRDARGLQHGAVTLWQLMVDANGKRTQLPALRIEDAPRFPWRGAMLDSARHFQSIDEIKRLLDAMALHKLNVCPNRCSRPIRCSITIGFHGRSKLTSRWQCCRL